MQRECTYVVHLLLLCPRKGPICNLCRCGIAERERERAMAHQCIREAEEGGPRRRRQWCLKGDIFLPPYICRRSSASATFISLYLLLLHSLKLRLLQSQLLPAWPVCVPLALLSFLFNAYEIFH
uniref:Uncharacterized protein n=1 Tax=Oryza brachyantha TaxID=4533 RepID=J3LIF0_ORYBR